MTTATAKARWYPSPAPSLDGEDGDAYADRLTGADGTGRYPYDHPRNRQCSIGWHGECSGWPCECPHHIDKAPPDVRHMPAWALDGAEVLAQLYDLPVETGWRVMAMAYAAAGRSDDTPNRADLIASLERAYGCAQSQDFVTDVLSVHAAAAAGKLARGSGILGT